MKKKLCIFLAVASLISISSTVCYIINQNNNNTLESNIIELNLKEASKDLLSTDNVEKTLSAISETTPVEKSKIYTQFGFNNEDNCYYMRAAIALKGNIQKVVFTREIIHNGQTSTKDFDVSTIYSGISANGVTQYYDGTKVTSDESYRGDYYWACYTAKYTSSVLAKDDVKITVKINDDENLVDTNVISLADLIDNTAILMKDEVIKYEAEDMINETLVGAIEESTAASNGKYVGQLEGNDTLQFNHNSNVSDDYSFAIKATNNGTTSADAFEAIINDNSLGTVNLDDRGSWKDNFYLYSYGKVHINEGDNSIKLKRNNTGNIDYISLSSYLELATTEQNQTFTIHSLNYQNVLLSLVDSEEQYDTSSFSITLNGNDVQLNSLLNLKPGTNTITINNNDILPTISLTHYETTPTDDNQRIILEAEEGIYGDVSLKKYSNYSGGLGLGDYKGYAYMPIYLDDLSCCNLSVLYSCYNDLTQYEVYVNNQLYGDSSIYNLETWDNPGISYFGSIADYLHEGENIIAIKAIQDKKFNLDAVVLQKNKVFDNYASLKLDVLDALSPNARLTTSITHLEYIKSDVSFKVQSTADTEVNISVIYAAEKSKNDSFAINTSSDDNINVNLSATGGWSNYRSTEKYQIHLKKGENTITLKYINGQYNLESLLIEPLN